MAEFCLVMRLLLSSIDVYQQSGGVLAGVGSATNRSPPGVNTYFHFQTGDVCSVGRIRGKVATNRATRSSFVPSTQDFIYTVFL